MTQLWHTYHKEHVEINLDESGEEQVRPGISYEYNVGKQAVIHIVEKGTGVLTYEGKNYYLRPGDAFLLQEGMPVKYTASMDDPWQYYWVGFSGSHVSYYLSQSSLLDHPTFHCSKDSRIPLLVDTLCQLSLYPSEKNNRLKDLKQMALLYELMYSMCEEFPKIEPQHSQSMNQPHIQNALQYIDEHYMEPISITDISEHINVSRSYLYKLFIKHLGQSPQNYLIHLRLYYGSLLLKDSTLSITEIAQSVGYSDPLLFSKIFSKHFSIAPSHYRKEHKKQQR